MKIKKGDNIQILLGKDQGKTAQVERVLTKKGQVVIPGVNVYKRHIRKGIAGSVGGIIEISKPINISNVALICPNCKRPTRVGFKIEGDEKIRICKRCHQAI